MYYILSESPEFCRYYKNIMFFSGHSVLQLRLRQIQILIPFVATTTTNNNRGSMTVRNVNLLYNRHCE